MTVQYRVQVVHSGRDNDTAILRDAVETEVRRLGLHQSVSVIVDRGAAAHNDVSVVVVLGGGQTAADEECNTAVMQAIDELRVVLPIVDDLAHFSEHVPPAAQPLNGTQWIPGDSPERVVRMILEELGIEERQRRVFISHRRTDGLLMAEQLHDRLTHGGFQPFIDRFHVRQGRDVQRAIADALEDYAFILFVESPEAHLSEWVFDEVMYARTHSMGMHILSFPGEIKPLPSTDRMPRQRLLQAETIADGNYVILSEGALDKTIREVEGAHAEAMVMRRRTLLRSVEDAAEGAGRSCVPLGGWRLLVSGSAQREIVQVSGRLPVVQDLFELDQERVSLPCDHGVLVHAARLLPASRSNVLAWAVQDRPLSLVPENAIGARW